MTKFISLSSTWRQWIVDNHARGCTPESMIEAMVRDNFEPSFAASCVHSLKGSASSPVEVPITPNFTNALWSQPYRAEQPRMQHKGSQICVEGHAMRVRCRMDSPVVLQIDNLLSDSECDELIRLSKVKLTPSTIVDPVTGKAQVIQNRTSSGTCFMINETGFVARIDHRIASVMCCPVENGEGIQILNYKVGGEYKTHFDYFPPDDLGSQPHIAKGGQRVSTLIIYLNDVEAGGETIFPKLNLSIIPTKGSAVYFEYCNSVGQVDPRSLHGGLPVVQGEKWIATKWMRQHTYAG